MDSILIIVFLIAILIGIALLYFKKSPTNNDNGEVVSLLKDENEKLKDENTKIQAELIEARTRLSANLEQMNDWEKTKQQFIEQAKSSSAEVSQNLMNDLLEKHNKQAENQRQQTEKSIQENTKKLHDSYKELFSSVDILKNNLEQNSNTINTIENALSSSANVGQASETILENVLTSFGLTSGVDFLTQVSTNIDDRQFRPDGLIFLPNDSALVIDSKASKFIFELAEAELSGNDSQIQSALDNLKSSMNNHLSSLTKKDYRTAIQKMLKEQGKETTLNDITMVMWLPNDASVEKLQKADPSIMQKASNNNIFICGPTALWTAIGVASQKINVEKQSKNNLKIRDEVEKLLGYIATVVEKGNKLERGLGSANSAWIDFKKSFNSRLYSSAKRIENYGVPSAKPIKSLGKEDDSDILEVESHNEDVKKIEH
ncbi:MAG: DNA recombination protein RmuC [Alphaproteobacteria bacterium]